MDVQQFGAFLQSRRKALGMTQSDLAGKLNVTDKAISRWERGVGFPDIKLLEPLANALELSLTELLKCEIMQAPLSMEDKMETVQILEEQLTISRKRKLILCLGEAAILCAAVVLVHISYQKELSFGLRYAAYAISLIGSFFASLALHFIVGKLYLNNYPWGKWEKVHTWIAWSSKIVGLLIMAFVRRLPYSNNRTFVMLLGLALFSTGLILEYRLKKKKEERLG